MLVISAPLLEWWVRWGSARYLSMRYDDMRRVAAVMSGSAAIYGLSYTIMYPLEVARIKMMSEVGVKSSYGGIL